jgi:lipooligosaccharide transport system permease protein
MVQLVTLPLFLFSATFYPLDVYPEIIQRITKISPLYHGVEIIRAAMLGSFDISLLGHVAFLAVMGAVGLTTAGRRLERLLLT